MEGTTGIELLRQTGLPSGVLYPALARRNRASRPAGETGCPPGNAIGPPGGVVRLVGGGGNGIRVAEMGWLPAVLVAIVTGYAVLARPSVARLTDLGVYTGAVGGLSHGASLYDFIQRGAPFTYPPFAGLLFLPLTWIPTPALQVLWTAATVGTVIALARLAARPGTPAIALVLLLSAPVSSDLRFGQVSLFLAALVLADSTASGRGLLIGLAAAVKLTPLIFIPMLWFGGRRRAAVTAAAAFACCGMLAAVVLPTDSVRFWTTEVRDVDRLGAIASAGNQSLNGALLRLGVPTPVRSLAVLFVGGLIVLLALRRAARLARAGDWFSATVVTGAAGVVFSPVSWTHHQVWLVLAAFLPVHRSVRLTAPAVMLLPVTALGPPLRDARLLLAIAIAAAVPITPRKAPAPARKAGRSS
jgi:alpha-1,2-mannosyltransferase